jgi:hypothetical protein
MAVMDPAQRDLRRIPGVGPSIADDLIGVGVRCVEDLRGRDPQELYERMQSVAGGPLDRCLLYVLREAVYFASAETHDPELLKWWNWKDRG